MDALLFLLLFFLALALAGWGAAFILFGRWRVERQRARDIDLSKRSQSTRYGNITEQFAPWMAGWPFEEREGFRFLGKPVDGVQFASDGIYLVEIKAATSRLSADQRAVREHVLAGRVGWVTFPVDGARDPEILRPWRK